MRAEQTLYDTLKADATVSGLVSQRIYPLVAPEDVAYPCITYQRVSGVPNVSLDGDSGLDYVRLQVSCWSKAHAESITLADAVRSALSTVALIASDVADYEQNTKLYRVSMDFKIWQSN